MYEDVIIQHLHDFFNFFLIINFVNFVLLQLWNTEKEDCFLLKEIGEEIKIFIVSFIKAIKKCLKKKEIIPLLENFLNNYFYMKSD